MNDVIEISYGALALGYVVIGIVIILLKREGIKKERELIFATLRMTIQLVLVSYILTYVFELDSPFYTFLFIAIMEGFACYTAFSRLKGCKNKRLKKVIALSLTTGTIANLCFFMWVVVQITPWYNSRYFILIAGMIVGNSMNGITLGATRLIDGFELQRGTVEGALMMGATPKVASSDIIKRAYDAAIMPSINSMLGMGIISLPGMMTGQILAGNSPASATRYQIAIMLAIFGATAISVYMLLKLGYKTFFNNKDQLIEK